jgi:hypothetical protein
MRTSPVSLALNISLSVIPTIIALGLECRFMRLASLKLVVDHACEMLVVIPPHDR